MDSQIQFGNTNFDHRIIGINEWKMCLFETFRLGSLEQYSANVPWATFPRKKLDITYGDIFSGLTSCFSLNESDRQVYTSKILNAWDVNGRCIVCLSVRTAFDLLLQTLNLPKGSEVMCSAITIPDMIYLIQYHGLVPIPLDLDPLTLSVSVEALKAANTEKSKLILIAHVFGSRSPLDEIGSFAKSHNLLLVEDCAQAFSGLSFRGSSHADISMFSFGTIKTSTAFGGALVEVQNSAIRIEMKRREERYSTRSPSFFLKRLLKYSLLHGLTTPAIYGAVMNTSLRLGLNHDKLITSSIRGFSGGDLVSLIRNRPSVPLLGLMFRRLSTVDEDYIKLRKEQSELLLHLLKETANIQVPGTHSPEHFYWLFPVMVPRPDVVASSMTKDGFDVTAGATQLTYVKSPYGVNMDPKCAKSIITSLVYLPVTPEMPRWAIEKMVHSLKRALQISKM